VRLIGGRADRRLKSPALPTELRWLVIDLPPISGKYGRGKQHDGSDLTIDFRSFAAAVGHDTQLGEPALSRDGRSSPSEPTASLSESPVRPLGMRGPVGRDIRHLLGGRSQTDELSAACAA
jgi:hypothetical protein